MPLLTSPSQDFRGFSLVKMLVAISVVSLLLALTIPTLSKVTETSKSVRCASTLRQLGVAFHAYASDHRGKFPAYPTTSNDRTQAWPWLISDYLGYDRQTQTPAVFACAGGLPHPNHSFSGVRGYSMNFYTSDAIYQNNTLEDGRQALLVEEWMHSPETPQHHTMLPVLGALQNKTYQNFSRSDSRQRLAWRHHGGMNVLCKDGSILRSHPGNGGWGDTIVWRIYRDGTQWRDGGIERP